MQELLQLPLQIQATLVAGYWGYIVLNRDYRNTEKLTDVWMLVLLLGLPTALAIQFLESNWAYLAVLSGPIIAFIWVKFAEAGWTGFLHRSKVSHTISSGDVWKTLSSYKGIEATQIKLIHKDGRQYLCDDTNEFCGDVFSPFIMDDDGIAFYVTDTKNAGGTDWIEVADVKLSSEYGSMITYFPRTDIHFLQMRYIKDIRKSYLKEFIYLGCVVVLAVLVYLVLDFDLL
ncbi:MULTISPECIES: hypothetical protein [unclassified Psychrobacter]|uniref:hypothetical protein n=1 Tax=unclassified Psychrobacter TaxID=196806 RepID=UPI003FD44869